MTAAQSKPVIGLSWEPKLSLLSSVTKNGFDKAPSLPASVAVYKPNAELVDGLFVPPSNPKHLNKLLRKQLKDTAGKNWFDMPAPTMTPELKKDIQLLKVGTVIESASDFFTGRLTKKERKATLADELLSDHTLGEYR
ncbi:Fcf2 pre-rRNA processing protein [Actinidia rufa]|uniref:Fcf2 pre-rRNA processing protein n=1 Tax=Actinidia rufa TaxID=165716 RepID=A0A7J0GF43_9ERIC|nr:Fcf2 pre-rRNA processing protein [Actinidia rufa]